jgi:2-polyprenyl-6-methoxyphenol hydroxylase-like FAD-dependent oxidoreductase
MQMAIPSSSWREAELMLRSGDTGDVVVVGAGPAGLVAAASLAGSGHRVLLVDRGSSTGDEPLILDRVGLEVLDGLGWRELVENHADARRHMRLRIDGEHETVELDRWDVVVVPRASVVDALRRVAASAGVVWLTGLTASVPVWSDRWVTGVKVRDGAGSERVLRGSIVIDASGPSSFLAAALGLLLPRRGSRRWRVTGHSPWPPTTSGQRLGLVDGQWLNACPTDRATLVTAVIRTPSEGPEADNPVAVVAPTLDRIGWGMEEPTIQSRTVGLLPLSHAGNGWVAIGEAAGTGAPGSPGSATTGLLAAASVAWECDLVLRSGKPPSAGMFGATRTVAQRAVQLGSLLDRALMRASQSGVLGWATATDWRRRCLCDVLRGDWSVGPRLGRGWYLWRLDRVSRRARRTRNNPCT